MIQKPGNEEQKTERRSMPVAINETSTKEQHQKMDQTQGLYTQG